MTEFFKNEKLFVIICSLLAILASVINLNKYSYPVRVEASGVVSIDISQNMPYTPRTEIISERTENSKKYYLGNNTYTLDISTGAIHYKDNYADKQEQWKDIDLTFENGVITRAPYVLTVNQDDKSFTLKDKKTGQTSTLKLTKVEGIDVKDLPKKNGLASKGKILWSDIATDLDIAVTADNSRVSFDWIVKSVNAPHEMEFEINDGGIPIQYFGTDIDHKSVGVITQKYGNRVTERIEKGGKYYKTINPTFSIGANTDDCYAYWFSPSSWGLFTTGDPERYVGEIMGTQGSSTTGAGFRFAGITISAGSTITAASLKVTSDGNYSATAVKSKITGDKENSPATFSTLSNFQNRRGTVAGGANNNYITSAQVNWDNIGSWTTNTEYTSPDISTVIQELINAHAPNNEAIALFWDDFDKRSSGGAYRVAWAYWYDSNKAAKLHIEYLSSSPSSYNFGNVSPNTTYSTALDYFTITNNSGSTVNITVKGTDMTGGTTWTLSDSATPGATTIGLKAGLSGGSFNIIIKKTAPYNTLKSSLADGTSQSWGLQLLAPTDYTDSTSKSGTVTLTAVTQ